MNNQYDDHWLVRAGTIKWLWRVFITVLALTVVAQLMFPVKGSFSVDGWFGFAAIYGFTACALMVLLAKALGFALKRRETYYRGDDDV